MAGAYDYDAVVSVQWPLGQGKSYTTFKYSNLSVSQSDFKAGDMLTFTIDVTNTGNMAGKESVLLFSSDLVASVSPDVRRLRQFDKVEIKPGETKTVQLTVCANDLAFVGADGKWILEEGDFLIQVGTETVRIHCNETHLWKTPNI